jgi:hypothetical protein
MVDGGQRGDAYRTTTDGRGLPLFYYVREVAQGAPIANDRGRNSSFPIGNPKFQISKRCRPCEEKEALP